MYKKKICVILGVLLLGEKMILSQLGLSYNVMNWIVMDKNILFY